MKNVLVIESGNKYWYKNDLLHNIMTGIKNGIMKGKS